MIGQAEQAFAAAHEDSAAQVLAAVRAGTDPAQVVPPSRDRIATLERSRQLAQADVVKAESAVTSAKRKRAEAQAAVNRAEAAAQTLVFEAARDEFARVFVQYRSAHFRAFGVTVAPPNFEVLAAQLSEVGE
jgi:hypothetical protein